MLIVVLDNIEKIKILNYNILQINVF